MTSRHPDFDASDPRAPSERVWAALSEAERARWVDALPSEFPAALPPEGDPHRKAKDGPLSALEAYFQRIGRKVYLSSNLPVYYPAERVFAPDLIAVMDVEPHERDRWVVSAEGKGLDFVLEVLYRGDDGKDLELNVERYARLGIQEYFIYDRRASRLVGYTLGGASASTYERIMPQHGHWPSGVLGLELALESDRLRLFSGTAALPDAHELALRAESLLAEAIDRVALAEERAEGEAKRAEEEAKRAEEEAKRAEEAAKRAEEAAKRADSAEARVAQLEAELARLRTQR
ncbi:MAG: Uma2 family endonuclease [Polyangiaceae bacterium]|nr:Uma2 family endonuclease [Polyangiaceae bacterium]